MAVRRKREAEPAEPQPPQTLYPLRSGSFARIWRAHLTALAERRAKN